MEKELQKLAALIAKEFALASLELEKEPNPQNLTVYFADFYVELLKILTKNSP